MGREDLELQEHDRLCQLTEVYGCLLPEAQAAILNLYFNDDLSLSEIAEERQCSRQAVHAHVRKASAALESYEAQLQLLAKRRQLELLLSQLESKQPACNLADEIKLLQGLLKNGEQHYGIIR